MPGPSTSSRLCGLDAYFKLENLQMTGSFKERGALNRILTLSEEERRRGLITASAGNHGQAVAYHANRLGLDATVVMPLPTPLIKVANTRNFGAGRGGSRARRSTTRRTMPGRSRPSTARPTSTPSTTPR